MPGAKSTKKDLYLGKSLADLNKFAEVKDLGPNVNVIIKSADKLYKEAQRQDDLADEERSYILFMKYFNVISQAKKKPDYKKQKEYFDSLIGNRNQLHAIDRAENLSKSLNDRYDLIEAESVAKKLEALDIKSENKQTDTKKDKKEPVEVEKGESENGSVSQEKKTEVVNSIMPTGLYNLIKDKTSQILIIDVRTTSEYKQSHIDNRYCINVPIDIVPPGDHALEEMMEKERLQNEKKQDVDRLRRERKFKEEKEAKSRLEKETQDENERKEEAERLEQELKDKLKDENLQQERDKQKKLDQIKQQQKETEEERRRQEEQRQKKEREEIAQERRKAENERLAQERIKADKERLAQEKAENERLAQERLAQERLKAEQVRIDNEKAKAEKIKIESEKARRLAEEKMRRMNDTTEPKVYATPGLPVGWEKRLDRNTNRYYYTDHNKGETHWEPPNSTPTKDTTEPKVYATPGLPVGWEKRLDRNTNRYYYTDHNKGETHWEPPNSTPTKGGK